MRVMMKVSMPVQSSNRAVQDGSLPKLFATFMEQVKPEAAYFVAEHGLRTAIFFFDLKDPSSIPVAAEPFFAKVDAAVELTPAMSYDDMKAGVERATKKA